MHLSITVLSGALWTAVRASQPGAAEPVAAPVRDLTWGKLNFLHTTDTHGWLGGHLLEPQYSADWGDYISFAKHMRKKADDNGVDLLVIDTGDRVEGNGLYDASNPKGLFTYDIFAAQNVDLLCTGNHELYKASTADREHNTMVPSLRESYVASNLDYYDERTGVFVPLAQRYKKFKTKNQGFEVISFGFLFDFTMNANNTRVQPVEEAIKEDWFKKVLREENPDVFIVVGHVGLRMPEYKAVFEAIRKAKWFTPILFFGGHAHVRDARKFDDKAFAMASGRYGETIGWASVDGIKKKKKDDKRDDQVSAEASVSFSRKYIDTNLYGLHYHTGTNETNFDTDEGTQVSKMIARARKAMGLDDQYGCAPRDLWMSRSEYPGNSSIYTWLEQEVLPDAIVRKDRKDKPRLAIANTGTVRFDIFKGAFTKDSTYIVSPFTSKFRYVPDVPYKVARKVIQLLNQGGPIFDSSVMDTRFMNLPEAMASKDLSASNSEADERSPYVAGDPQQHPMGVDVTTNKPDLISGYTTKDDLGTDGDDTEHTPLKFYSVPNCVQAEIGFPAEGEPESVDLVFLDFIQQWVLIALKFSGGDYSDKDVDQWDDETLTYKLGKWISENWKGDC